MFAVNQRNSCPYFSFDALEAPQPDEASSELCATLEVLRECASTKTDVLLPEHRIFCAAFAPRFRAGAWSYSPLQ
jgi:hypothetical protein